MRERLVLVLALAACAQSPGAPRALSCPAIAVQRIPATAALAPPPSEQVGLAAGQEAEFVAYVEPVRKGVLRKWLPPAGRRSVQVEFSIRADGCVPAVSLSERVRRADVAAVVRAFQRSLPFPPPPAALVAVPLEATFAQELR